MDEIERTKLFFNRKRENTGSVSPVQAFVFDQTRNAIPNQEKREYALDVGCHWGRYTKYLASSYRKVWGVDYSEIALQSAEQAGNIEYACLDVDLDGARMEEMFPPMDLVIAICVFEMLRRPDRLASTAYRLLRPGGKLFVVIPNRYSLNFVSVRIALWFGNRFRGKDRYIWNNKITPQILKSCLLEAGFLIEEEKMVVGVPVYLFDRLPYAVQSFFIGIDWILKWIGGSGYYCVSAGKSLRET